MPSFIENFRTGRRYWWLSDRTTIVEIGNDKRMIQCEKCSEKRMLIEVIVDDPNNFRSCRANKLDVGRP